MHPMPVVRCSIRRLPSGGLGVPTGFFSGLSTDLMGEVLAEALAASQVDITHCARSARPTTLAFVKLVNGQATYAFYDENTAGRLLSATDLPVLTPDVQALFFGGISLVNDPAASTYATLQAREAGHRVTMLDPNIRPGFITDETGVSRPHQCECWRRRIS